MAAPTIRDVAKRAGVGVGTVSRVINGSASVRDSTRQKVLAAIEELGFSPNLAARRLSRGKTMTIGVVVPFFTHPSVVRRLQGVVSVTTNTDYDLVLFDIESEERSAGFLRRIPKRGLVDGLLIISLMPQDEDVAYFKTVGLPTVLVDAYHPHLSRVVIDNVIGGFMATQYLIELGHRKIGFISDFLEDPFNRSVLDRYRGYRQGLTNAGIPYREAYHLQDEHGSIQARQMALNLLAMDDPPTAIFAYSDTQAIGVLEAAKVVGLQVPEQLSVIGFDNIEVSEYFNLTTVRQGLFDSGVRGCQMLLEEMETQSAEPQQNLLPTEVIIRGTTAVYQS